MSSGTLDGKTSLPSGSFTIHAHEVLANSSPHPWYRRILPFLGPAFIAAIAYVDPGNFATNIQGGARFGYLLVWVIVASNLMAMIVQSLSAKLGIATGMNLAEVSRDHMPDALRWFMWAIAEIVAMATDIAEFLGAALGMYLLFGIPLLPATLLTGVATFFILGLQKRGARPLEALIAVMIGVIAACYLIQTLIVGPSWGAVGSSLATPRFDGNESILLAVGILGATVMPHVIYLHSALTQRRIVAPTPDAQRRLFRFELVDIVIAMSLAGAINAAMLIMAASTFYQAGLGDIASIEVAHRTLEPLVGPASSALFGVSLLVSGLASTTVGTLAGQTVMQGYLHRQIPLWLRRLVTMLPTVVVVALGIDATTTLVLSQVVLSFGIPFALIPLVIYTARADIMGKALVNRRLTTVVASLISVLIIALNAFLLWETFLG
ncbi:MAG TPA: Nramp family divalent metal transporter [Thermomicrobiales bacterium]|nr:Nramp family divalent metal transporter [Thermomicrobiales bacterium]